MNPNNLVILTGNLGNDPEIKVFDNGNGCASFSLATSDSYKNKQGKKVTNVEWHKCILFNKYEVAEKYLKKGSQINLIGSLRTRNWIDSKGDKKYITEILVFTFTMMGGNKEQSSNQSNENEPPPDNESNNLPF